MTRWCLRSSHGQIGYQGSCSWPSTKGIQWNQTVIKLRLSLSGAFRKHIHEDVNVTVGDVMCADGAN